MGDLKDNDYSPRHRKQNYICYSDTLTVRYGDTMNAPEKAMAAHSSTLAWKIPWAEEPGGLQSMGSLRVGHD